MGNDNVLAGPMTVSTGKWHWVGNMPNRYACLSLLSTTQSDTATVAIWGTGDNGNTIISLGRADTMADVGDTVITCLARKPSGTEYVGGLRFALQGCTHIWVTVVSAAAGTSRYILSPV